MIMLLLAAAAAFIVIVNGVDAAWTLSLKVAGAAVVAVVAAMAVRAARSGDAYRVAERRRWLESASGRGPTRTREGVENGWSFCAIALLAAAGAGGGGWSPPPPVLPMIWPVHAAGLKVDREARVRCSKNCWSLLELAVPVSSTYISAVDPAAPAPKDTEDTAVMSTSRAGDGARDGG